MEQESSGAHKALTSLTHPSPTQPSPQPLSLHMDSCPNETADLASLADPACAEMRSPPCEAEEAVPPERVQPEGEHCPPADNAPSLASALLELHQLLVSNGCTGSQDPPAQHSRPNADGLDVGSTPRSTDPEDPQDPPPTPSPPATSSAEHSDDAKANHAAPAAEKAESECLGPAGQEGPCVSGEGPEGQGAPPCPEGCWEGRAEGREKTSSGPEASTAHLQIREPPEGQQGRGVADGRASGTFTPDTPGLPSELPLQSNVAPVPPSPSQSPAAQLTPVSPGPMSPGPAPMERFPAGHLQRIQAAGFSAREAAEALEQAHGVVELALLALLARNITVPT